MNAQRPVVLIGPVSDDPTESVSGVNRAFIEGLSRKYRVLPSNANRRFGSTRQARINPWNLYYLVKHTVIWIWNLLRHRPAVAHYAISSGWALHKGLALLWLARLFGARTVGHLHSGAFIDYWNRLSPRRKRFTSRRLARLDAFVVLSEAWRRKIIEHLGLNPEKLFVVNNPIDREFEKGALEIPLIRPGKIVFALGIMGRDKGVFEILAAAENIRRRAPDFRLQLAGPEREPGTLKEVKDQIEKRSLGDCVELLPSVWGQTKLDLFRNASIFLLPSYYENFPLVVLEAAAAGQAIVATPVGATPEFFAQGQSALFVPPRNSQEIADAILMLLESPEHLQRLGAGARSVFRSKLSREGIMKSLEAVYRNVIDRSAARRANMSTPDGLSPRAAPMGD